MPKPGGSHEEVLLKPNGLGGEVLLKPIGLGGEGLLKPIGLGGEVLLKPVGNPGLRPGHFSERRTPSEGALGCSCIDLALY